MEKVLRLYKYIDGINDIAFPNEKEQAIITSFRYDAKRMGSAPTISFSLMHSLCLDSLWDNKVYASFNGERFYVKQTPTSSYSSSDTRYKHEVELVSERFILDNIYFYDVVSSSSQDKPVSNSSKFSFFGNIKEYVSRLNNSLNKSNVGYSIVIDDDILSDEALKSIESQVTFEDQVITNALQEIYNVYKIPYYFVGKTIHVGYYQDNIDTVFKYGCKNSLISISKNNANSKIINKITGVGSSDNIPYYYPNVDEKGITQVLCNGREGESEIIDLAKYRKVKLADKFVFHETIQSLVPLIDEDDYSFGDFRDEGVDGDGKQRVSIDFYYSFTLQQYESVEFSVTTTYEDSLDLRYEIFNPSGQYVGYYKGDKTMQLTGGNYQFVIRWSFESEEPMIGSDDVIKNFVSQYLNIKANIVVNSSNAWTKNNIPVTLSDYGISVNSPSDGDVLTIERLAYIQPQPNLVPPIYRNTEGGERFYEAINGKYKNEQGGYYQFDNEYTPTNPREHIENFDDIKPTIKNVINGSGYYIDEFIDFAYDLDDNDETDESGKFIHPYFFGKLRRFDGEFGFNLFDHAIDEGEMVVSMTSGTCGSCEFVIGVDEQSQKNKVQVDSDGNLVRDNNGNVRRTGTPQDRQNDTKNNEVWIALKKDIQTFGVVMPNVGNNYRPKAGDKFVLLHIDLPQQYVEEAENALKDKLIKYMHENNFEKFNFSIAFSRIYFAENPTILANLSENSKIQVEYNKNIYDLYVSSLSYSISNDSALPEVKVELEDALAISQNQITQVVESTKREIISSIDKDVFWGDIKGVPTWITSDKPRYSYSELSGRGASDNSNDVWVVKKDAQGNSYVYTKLDVVVERGVTMYGTDGSVDVPSIFEGLPIDNDTIYWEETKDEEGNVIAKVLKSKGTPDEDGGADFSNVMESGVGNAYTSFTLSEDKKILTFVKGETFAKQSDYEALNTKVTDFLEGSDTDNIINKWKELESFLSGMKESDELSDILSEKADWGTTLAHYGITDAYTKTAVDGLLEDKADTATTLAGYGITNAYTKTQVDNLIGDFVTSDDVETLLDDYLPLTGGTIAGDLRLRKGSKYTSPYLYFGDSSEVWLKEESDTYLTIHAEGGVNIDSPATFIDGIKIEKSADGVLYIDADLVVKGGVTMFANEGSYTPSTIMDAVSVDNQTIIKQGGKLMVNPELVFGGGGGEVSTVTWGNVLGKPTWITNTKPVYKYTEISGTPDLSVYALTESLNNYQSKITTTNKLSYSLIDGTPNLSVYALKSDLNGYQIKITESNKLAYSLVDDTPDLSVYATKGISLSHYGITDAYTKTNVDSLLSDKWTKDDTKISNWDTAYSWGNHAQAGYFKSVDFTKDKIKTTLGISDWALASVKPSYTTKEVAEDTNLYFTNARAVSALTETLKGYVTLSGTQTITGEKNFTGGLKVNGSPIVYNATRKYWKLEGDLLVTGGVTMFGNDSAFSPSTITQAVNVDGTTIINDGKKLMLNPDIQLGGGGVTDYNDLTNKPDLSVYALKTSLSSYATKSTTLSGYGISDAYTKNESDNKYLLKSSYTANDVLAKLKTVDGAKSGLDADTLDGKHADDIRNSALKFAFTKENNGNFRDANLLDGGILINYNSPTVWKNTPSGMSYGAILDISYDLSRDLTGQLAWDVNQKMWFRMRNSSDWTSWREMAFTDSDITGNAATATALKNARTLWGNSFDGANNVSGSISLNTNKIFWHGDTNNYYISCPSDTGGAGLMYKAYSSHRFVSGGSERLTILSSGYVGVNKSNPTTAFYVSGTSTFDGNIVPSTHNTYNIGSYDNGFAWSNFNCISSGAVSNNLWLCGGTTNGIGVVIARSNSNTATGELCRFTEQGMVWASGMIPAIVSTAQEIHLKYNNADATSIVFNGASFKPFISASDNIMLGRYDSLWKGLFLSTDASVPRTEKGVTFCSSNGYAEGKIGANSRGIGIYTVGGLYLRGGCTKGANGTMTESSTGVVIDASGNMLVTGGVTMYSDLRKKTILNHVELSLKEVADAPLIEHYYNSDESKRTHVGSVAQYWAGLNDWFCKEDEEGFLTMEIQNAALASAISVARELTRYESKTDKQIKKLKKRIGELEEEIENLKKI